MLNQTLFLWYEEEAENAALSIQPLKESPSILEPMTTFEERAQGGKTMKKWLKVLIVMIWASTLTLSYPLFAINGVSNRATFRGLTGVGVLVEKLPPEVEQEGLKRDQLQMEVESKLRTAGIKVLTKEEAFNTPGEPFLYININVNIAQTESEIYPYSVDLLLIQKVSLVRDPKLASYAITWSTGGVGSIGKQILSQLRENVETMVDVFIKIYLAENPK
jgi:hypothetical protein